MVQTLQLCFIHFFGNLIHQHFPNLPGSQHHYPKHCRCCVCFLELTGDGDVFTSGFGNHTGYYKGRQEAKDGQEGLSKCVKTAHRSSVRQTSYHCSQDIVTHSLGTHLRQYWYRNIFMKTFLKDI